MPKFECRIPDYHGSEDDSWTKWPAFDAESAAEACAQEYYEDDPGDPYDLDVTVEVRDEHGNVTKWAVTASTSVHFSARPVEEAKAETEQEIRRILTAAQPSAEDESQRTDGDIS